MMIIKGRVRNKGYLYKREKYSEGEFCYKILYAIYLVTCLLEQVSATPSLRTGICPQPLRNQAAQASKASSAHVWDIDSAQKKPCPPPSLWNFFSSMEPVPAAQNVGAIVLEELKTDSSMYCSVNM